MAGGSARSETPNHEPESQSIVKIRALSAPVQADFRATSALDFQAALVPWTPYVLHCSARSRSLANSRKAGRPLPDEYLIVLNSPDTRRIRAESTRHRAERGRRSAKSGPDSTHFGGPASIKAGRDSAEFGQSWLDSTKPKLEQLRPTSANFGPTGRTGNIVFCSASLFFLGVVGLAVVLGPLRGLFGDLFGDSSRPGDRGSRDPEGRTRAGKPGQQGTPFASSGAASVSSDLGPSSADVGSAGRRDDGTLLQQPGVELPPPQMQPKASGRSFPEAARRAAGAERLRREGMRDGKLALGRSSPSPSACSGLGTSDVNSCSGGHSSVSTCR